MFPICLLDKKKDPGRMDPVSNDPDKPAHCCVPRTDCGVFLTDQVRLVLAGCDNLTTEVKRARVLMDQKGEASEVGLLFKSMENQIKEIETQVTQLITEKPRFFL